MGLITGGAGLLGSYFTSQTSGQNTMANIAAQQAAQQSSQAFNAQQAQIGRDFSAGQIEGQQDYNAAEALKARDFSASQAEINRGFQAQQVGAQQQFQQQMSNTAYQRAAADMKAAGLNPMMMFGSGSAASSPSGAAASGSLGGSSSASAGAASGGSASIGTPNMALSHNRSAFADLGDNISKAVNSAVSMKQFDRMTDEIANLKVTRDRIIAETGTESERKDLVHKQAETESKRPENIAQATTAAKLDRARQEWEAIKYLDLSSIPDVARKTGNIGSWGGQKVSDVLAPLLSSARGVRDFIPRRSTSEVTDSRTGDSRFTERWEGLFR